MSGALSGDDWRLFTLLSIVIVASRRGYTCLDLYTLFVRFSIHTLTGVSTASGSLFEPASRWQFAKSSINVYHSGKGVVCISGFG